MDFDHAGRRDCFAAKREFLVVSQGYAEDDLRYTCIPAIDPTGTCWFTLRRIRQTGVSGCETSLARAATDRFGVRPNVAGFNDRFGEVELRCGAQTGDVLS